MNLGWKTILSGRLCMRRWNAKQRFLCTKLLDSKNMGWTTLKNRAVLRVSGPDTIPFLQGMLTNDTTLFERGQRSLYALMLNTQGRVQADLLLHSCVHSNGQIDILVECHEASYKILADTLVKYKMRKRVDLQRCTETISVISIFPLTLKLDQVVNGFDNREMFVPATPKFASNSPPLSYGPDPRLPALGARLLVCTDDVSDNVLGGTGPSSVEDYDSVRYMLGVGEGPTDIPPAKALPLEGNGDYLNGISFHKGCYIGQELTARTHHTGVVRKRLLPLILNTKTENAENIEFDAIVKDVGSGKSVGKWRAGRGCYGLALLRIDEALQENAQLGICVGEDKTVACKAVKPFWWAHTEISGEIKAVQ